MLKMAPLIVQRVIGREQKMKNIGRRSFFSKISLGAFGTMIFSMMPFSLFAGSKKKPTKKVKVQIHPKSVKRIK